MTTTRTPQMLTSSPIQDLTAAECWRLLATTTVGRLAVAGPDGIEIFPVNFLLSDETVLFRSAPGGKLALLTGGADVAVEADGVENPFRWSVVVHGEARRLDADDEIEASGVLDLVSDVPQQMTNFVRVTPTRVTGRRFRVEVPR